MRPAILALALAAATLLAGCSGGDSPSGTTSGHAGHTGTTGGSGGSHVELKDDLFVGGNRAFTAGTMAHFENTGQKGHTVTVHKVGEPTTTLRHDKPLAAGESTQVTFADAGTYHVWCRYHGTMTSGMAMTVTVS